MANYPKTVTIGDKTLDVKALIKNNTKWHVQRLKDIAAQTLSTLEGCAKLAAAGLYTPTDYGSYDTAYVTVDDRLRLPLYRKALGVRALKQRGVYPHDARKQLVKVHLRADEYPGITFTYVRKLAKGGKCKIVSERPRVRHSLVCSNGTD